MSCCENNNEKSCYEGELHCPVDAAVRLIGGKYKTMILWQLAGGVMRFGELKKAVSDATPKMLTRQLRELEDDGLIVRTVYPVVPPKVEYTLSDFGKTIIPVLNAMYKWGEGYLAKSGLKANCAMRPLDEIND